METEKDILDPGYSTNGQPENLPNSTAVLVLGICSIATCWLYGVPGLACGIIAIVLYNKDKKLYDSNPAKYQKSYGNLKAGFICGIIGMALSVLFLIYIIVILSIFGAAISQAGAYRSM